jgi:hypothetical protein
MSHSEDDHNNMQASNTPKSADSERNILLREDELQHVLAMVPSEDRVRMRTVSKLFNKTFTRIGYHLDPVFVRDHCKGSHCFPFYPPEVSIQLHPMFSRDILLFDNHDHTIVDRIVKFWLAPDLKEMEERRHQSITSPPISTVCLVCPNFRGHNYAVLRTVTHVTKRLEGIRVGDLQDTFDKMKAHNPRASMDSFLTTHASSDEIIATEESPSEKTGRKRSADEMEDGDGVNEDHKKKAKTSSTLSSKIPARPKFQF